ncbi:hypothetical protein Vretimale_1909, partial [Volvox reticuliferus]
KTWPCRLLVACCGNNSCGSMSGSFWPETKGHGVIPPGVAVAPRNGGCCCSKSGPLPQKGDTPSPAPPPLLPRPFSPTTVKACGVALLAKDVADGGRNGTGTWPSPEPVILSRTSDPSSFCDCTEQEPVRPSETAFVIEEVLTTGVGVWIDEEPTPGLMPGFLAAVQAPGRSLGETGHTRAGARAAVMSNGPEFGEGGDGNGRSTGAPQLLRRFARACSKTRKSIGRCHRTKSATSGDGECLSHGRFSSRYSPR